MTDDIRSADVFRLTVPEGAPWALRLGGALAVPVMDRLLGLKRCREIYGTIGDQPSETFAEAALDALGIQWQIESAELAKIPAQGPLVVVANHPFGAVEGLMIIALLRQVRSDIKVMANYLLQGISQLADTVIAVDPFGASQSARRNIGPLRDSLRWLGQKGCWWSFPPAKFPILTPLIGRWLTRVGALPSVGSYAAVVQGCFQYFSPAAMA